MELKKYYRLYKHMILMGIWLVVSVAGFIFGIIPLAEQTVTLWQNVNTLSDDVNLLQQKSGVLDSLDEATLRANVLTLASAVPPDKSLPTIFTTLDTASGLSGVTITDITLTNPGSLATASAGKLTSDEQKVGSNLLPFSVTGRGSYAQAVAFLSTISSVRRMFRLRTMDVSTNAETVSLRANFDAFYFPYPTTVGSIQSVVPLSDPEQKILSAVSALPLDSVTAVSTVSASVPSGKADPFSL